MTALRSTHIAALFVCAALAAVLAGAYLLGAQQAVAPSGAPPAAGHPPPPAARGTEPARRPPAKAAQAGERPIAGKVGAALAPDKRFTHFRVGDKNVKRVYVDGERVWVGTSGGLIRYTTNTDDYKLYDMRSGLLSNGIFHVGKLRGRIVVGTYGGGMSVLDAAGEKWKTYSISEGLGDAFVSDVLQAKGGDVWIATWSGVNRVRGGSLDDASKWELHTVASTDNGLPSDRVYALAEGRNGDIWLATEGGMTRYRQGKWSNWNHARVSPHHAGQKEETGPHKANVAHDPNFVVALSVEKSGTVWAGTWGAGLVRYDGRTWRSITRADGLPGDHVFMLHHDAKGRLWIGTNNGLARMENGKFHVLTTADGLFANAVFAMASTEDSLWVGSFGGVARIRRVD